MGKELEQTLLQGGHTEGPGTWKHCPVFMQVTVDQGRPHLHHCWSVEKFWKCRKWDGSTVQGADSGAVVGHGLEQGCEGEGPLWSKCFQTGGPWPQEVILIYIHLDGMKLKVEFLNGVCCILRAQWGAVASGAPTGLHRYSTLTASPKFCWTLLL